MQNRLDRIYQDLAIMLTGKSNVNKQDNQVVIENERMLFTITDDNHQKYVLSEGDVVIARTGATVGVAKMLGKNIPDAVFASFLVRIRPNDDDYKYFFGLTITSKEFLEFVQTNAGGSAQPQANPPLLGEYDISLPDKENLIGFNQRIACFLNIIVNNEMEITKLNEVKTSMIEMLSSR